MHGAMSSGAFNKSWAHPEVAGIDVLHDGAWGAPSAEPKPYTRAEAGGVVRVDEVPGIVLSPGPGRACYEFAPSGSPEKTGWAWR